MRLIDADALLDDVRKHTSSYVEDFVKELVDKQPTAQPRWIPVTERLPDKGGPYLCTVQGYVGKTTYLRIAVFQTDIYVEYDIEEHKPGFIDHDSECGFYEVTKVLAWMPLPKPYKEGEANDLSRKD